jgi:thiamine-phosphate pyrophosphorylase
MKLVIKTKSTFFVEEDKILTTLFEEGLGNLHLYKPDSSPLYSELLLSLLPDYTYKKITVHQHYYLKEEYKLAGIHIDEASAELPGGYHGRFSRTCTSIAELKEAKRKSQYVFLQNIFPTLDDECLGMNELEEASRQGLIDRHVYAMGGVTLSNIPLCRDLGFGGVVIDDDLWNKFDIHNQTNYKELIEHYTRLAKAVD